jgi:iron-sulfur cluster repair protein YtfE (RIC family)
MSRREAVVESLEHDHADLNRDVVALRALVGRIERGEIGHDTPDVADHIMALRDHLFLHFVREEEGLFPFLAKVAPDLEPAIAELIGVHDEICGALARMVQIIDTTSYLDALMPLFERFQAAYVRHAHAERALLEEAAARLTGEQRVELGAWLRGI